MEFASARDIWTIIPIFIIFLTSLVPVSIKLFRGNQEQKPMASLLQIIGGLVLAAIFILSMTGDKSYTAFSGAIISDGLARWSNIVLLFVAIVCSWIGVNNINTRGNQYSEILFLFLNSVIGMMVLCWSNDLIVSFIGLEIMSLALYVLVALSHEQVLAKEAAFKYFILGSLAAAIFLYGIALIYGSAESTNLQIIAEKAPELIKSSFIFQMGVLLLIIGLLFKVSIFPFHAWTPDVYQGAPTPVTAFMSTAVKIACFVLLARVMATGVLTQLSGALSLLQWLAVLSIVYGNIGALLQDNLKRMLAYSSIAHSGYILAGICVLAHNPSDINILSSILFYLVSYAIVNVGALAFVSLNERSEDQLLQVQDLAGFGLKKPLWAMLFTILLLSLAGIPPLAGFWAKLYLFSAAVKYEFYWLAIWGVLGSVISVYYYLRPIVVMYMKEKTSDDVLNTDHTAKLAFCFSAVLLVVIGLASGGLWENITSYIK